MLVAHFELPERVYNYISRMTKACVWAVHFQSLGIPWEIVIFGSSCVRSDIYRSPPPLAENLPSLSLSLSLFCLGIQISVGEGERDLSQPRGVFDQSTVGPVHNGHMAQWRGAYTHTHVKIIMTIGSLPRRQSRLAQIWVVKNGCNSFWRIISVKLNGQLIVQY